MAGFPEKARVVIVGQGGIVGASIAHHLIERGWDDIVGIDKSGIPTDNGSTAHAAGASARRLRESRLRERERGAKRRAGDDMGASNAHPQAAVCLAR